MQFFTNIFSSIAGIFELHQGLADVYTSLVRWIFPLLALILLLKVIRSLLQGANPAEKWAILRFQDGTEVPVTHWENVIGRARNADVVLSLSTVSRNHGILMRDVDGYWYYNDLGSKAGSFINGERVTEKTRISFMDEISICGVRFMVIPVTEREKKKSVRKRLLFSRPESPWSSLILLTAFQWLAGIEFMASYGSDCPFRIPFIFLLLSVVMWVYYLVMKSFRRVAFEMETIAFFLTTLGFAVCATAAKDDILKQFIAFLLGLGLFIFLCWFLRDLSRCKKVRFPLIIFGGAMLLLNLLLGTVTYGARNWISLGFITFQPSEIVKLIFIFAGAATLDELFQKGNLTLYVVFSGVCFAALGLMGDFGTALIFYVTFVVISFLRSGDFRTLVLFLGAAAAGGFLVLRFKPYIANRFAAWGHVWEYASTTGYQQTRTMSAAASGGFVGLGGGKGWLHNIAASETDLVFGVLCEEWGLLIGILAVCCIITLAIFAVKSISSGRSTFYTIAACAGVTILVMQTMLNVFGSVDLLPLTGVTFPFISVGGTSMIVSWGMLAFLKATDTRQNASLAVSNREKNKISRGGEQHEEA